MDLETSSISEGGWTCSERGNRKGQRLGPSNWQHLIATRGKKLQLTLEQDLWAQIWVLSLFTFFAPSSMHVSRVALVGGSS